MIIHIIVSPPKGIDITILGGQIIIIIITTQITCIGYDTA
jgi:hypothetical protein